jgi:opacity protein-like surface antigen
MKLFTKLVAAAAVAAATISAPAMADDKGIYALGSLGVSQTDIDVVSVDESFNFEIGLGYDFGNDVRTELTWEKNYLSSLTSQGVTVNSDASFDSFLVSLYKDFSNESKVTPFIGAGVGSTSVNDTSNTWDSAFTYALSVGASYEASENTDLYAKVQTLYASPKSAGFNFDSNAVSAKVGVRYSF